MPIRCGQDSNGPYFQYGYHGKCYYYIPNNKKSREIAKNRAIKQGKAIKVRQGKFFLNF